MILFKTNFICLRIGKTDTVNISCGTYWYDESDDVEKRSSFQVEGKREGRLVINTNICLDVVVYQLPGVVLVVLRQGGNIIIIKYVSMNR